MPIYPVDSIIDNPKVGKKNDITSSIEEILQIFLRHSIEEQDELFDVVSHRLYAIRTQMADDLEAQLEEITLKLEKVRNSKNFKNENPE